MNNRAANLTSLEKYSFGIGAIGKDMAFNIVGGFYMLFLVLVIGLNGTIVGIAFALTRVFDAINDPIMGTIVDNTRTKWGKYRPWLAIGTLSNAVILILMHLDFDLGNAGSYAFYLTMYVVWGITYTLMDVPYWSMIPAISGTKAERNSISSIARIFAAIGGAVSTATIPIIYQNYGYGNKVFLVMSAVTACLFTFFMTFTVVFTKEKIIIPSAKIKLKEIFNVIRKNDQLLAYLATFSLYAIGGTIMTTAGIYYFKVVLNNEGLMTVFLAIGGIGGTGISMILYPKLAARFSRRNLYIFALIFSIAGFVVMSAMSFMTIESKVMLIGLLTGGWMVFFALGIANVGATVMLADIVDYGEWKTGNRNENITFSMQTFVYKCAAAVSSLIMGIALSVGNIPKIDPQGNFVGEVTSLGKAIIKIVIFVLPIIFFIPSYFLYIKMYKLNGKYQDDMLDELYATRDKNEQEAIVTQSSTTT